MHITQNQPHLTSSFGVTKSTLGLGFKVRHYRLGRLLTVQVEVKFSLDIA
jgi:hypothetical protein